MYIQIAVVCGPCTAGGAYVPTMCDEAVIVKGIGSLYLGGPPLVKVRSSQHIMRYRIILKLTCSAAINLMQHYSK